MRILIYYAIQIVIVILIVQAILSWIPIHPSSAFYKIRKDLTSVTNVFLAPIRKVIPPVGGGGVQIDLSVMVLIVILEVVAKVVG
ncbi:MAG: YggT family protein [Acidimicrobiales bacterium]|nr:YggT family protein [Acidimicrobiales bacterium]